MVYVDACTGPRTPFKPMKTIEQRIKLAIAEVRKLPQFVQMKPKEINSGWCYEFAGEVIKRVPEAKYGMQSGHGFVWHNNKYYDVERSNGVSTASKLPYMQRSKAYKHKINGLIDLVNSFDEETLFHAREVAWRSRRTIDEVAVQLLGWVNAGFLQTAGMNSGRFVLYRRIKKIKHT